MDVKNLSERFACQVVGLCRSTFQRTPRAQTPDDPDRWLREWLRQFAKNHIRWGFKRAHAELRAQGYVVNKKKVQRVWRAEGLNVPVKRRKKVAGMSTGLDVEATAANMVWSIARSGDASQFDTTTDGRPFKFASMVDEHTRESLLNIVDRSITAADVIAAIADVVEVRGVPHMLRCDNGPEFISKALREFCSEAITIGYIPPGQPWKNGFIESFNNRLRDECLSMELFDTVLHARSIIGGWKERYNRCHRHSALDYVTPAEYAETVS